MKLIYYLSTGSVLHLVLWCLARHVFMGGKEHCRFFCVMCLPPPVDLEWGKKPLCWLGISGEKSRSLIYSRPWRPLSLVARTECQRAPLPGLCVPMLSPHLRSREARHPRTVTSKTTRDKCTKPLLLHCACVSWLNHDKFFCQLNPVS